MKWAGMRSLPSAAPAVERRHADQQAPVNDPAMCGEPRGLVVFAPTVALHDAGLRTRGSMGTAIRHPGFRRCGKEDDREEFGVHGDLPVLRFTACQIAKSAFRHLGVSELNKAVVGGIVTADFIQVCERKERLKGCLESGKETIFDTHSSGLAAGSGSSVERISSSHISSL